MEVSLPEAFDAIATAVPDREALVFRDRRFTYADLADRSKRLANVLLEAGCEVHTERGGLEGHESGQDHLALYLYNGNEYIEGMLGAYRARVAPFNVNYRYVAEELEYLLNDAGAKAIIYHAEFAPVLAEVLPRVPSLTLLLQVADDSGEPLLEGAVDYEEALAAASPADPPVTADPDDLYILYTGGTTGMPKGVLWRQADIFMGALGGRPLGSFDEVESIEKMVETAKAGGAKLMPGPPFMHGAAHWAAFNMFHGGGTVIVPPTVKSLDPKSMLQCACDEGVNILLMVGDAFARPLCDEIEAGDYDLSNMLALSSGGAILSAPAKKRILELVPHAIVNDGLGSSETGAQAAEATMPGEEPESGKFKPGGGMCIVDENLTGRLEAGHEGTGWLAQEGRVPLGYLGDAAKTATTFPLIGGVRYSVPGDRARLLADGTLDLLGRDSVTINSGGEKIFAEEVERALAYSPHVADVVVCGRPSERWGNEVTAIVQLANGSAPTAETEADLTATASEHIARYKLPKGYVFVDEMVRSPSGKADYRWAKAQAVGSA